MFRGRVLDTDFSGKAPIVLNGYLQPLEGVNNCRLQFHLRVMSMYNQKCIWMIFITRFYFVLPPRDTKPWSSTSTSRCFPQDLHGKVLCMAPYFPKVLTVARTFARDAHLARKQGSACIPSQHYLKAQGNAVSRP